MREGPATDAEAAGAYGARPLRAAGRVDGRGRTPCAPTTRGAAPIDGRGRTPCAPTSRDPAAEHPSVVVGAGACAGDDPSGGRGARRAPAIVRVPPFARPGRTPCAPTARGRAAGHMTSTDPRAGA